MRPQLLLLAALALTATACADDSPLSPSERPGIKPSAAGTFCPPDAPTITSITTSPASSVPVNTAITITVAATGSLETWPPSVQWDVTGGSGYEPMPMVSAATASATHSYSTPGTYTVNLFVGCTLQAVTVTVTEPGTGGEQPGGEQPGGEQPGGEQGTNPPAAHTPTPVSAGGCTRTQGYWKQSKHAWPAPYTRDADYFTSDRSWQEILNTSPSRWPQANGGQVYIQLGYQYIAATLNAQRNGGAPAHVGAAIDAAWRYFTGTAMARADAEQLKNLLDRFNNGLEGVPHCR